MTWLSTNPSKLCRQLIVFVRLPMGTNTQTGHEGSQHETKYQSAPCCLVAVRHINHSYSMFWRWESRSPFKSIGGDTSVVLISVTRQSCPSPQTGSASRQDPLSDSSSRLLQRNTTHLLVYVSVCLCLCVWCTDCRQRSAAVQGWRWWRRLSVCFRWRSAARHPAAGSTTFNTQTDRETRKRTDMQTDRQVLTSFHLFIFLWTPPWGIRNKRKKKSIQSKQQSSVQRYHDQG